MKFILLYVNSIIGDFGSELYLFEGWATVSGSNVSDDFACYNDLCYCIATWYIWQWFLVILASIDKFIVHQHYL